MVSGGGELCRVEVVLKVATRTCLAPQPLQGCVFKAGIGTAAEGVLEYLGYALAEQLQICLEDVVAITLTLSQPFTEQ